jgi:polyisoprenoid-binding protein YceI
VHRLFLKEIAMNKNIVLCCIASALALPASAADTYTIDPEFSIPTFDVEYLGFTTQHGRFDKTEGRVVLDVAAQKGLVEFTVHTRTLDMGSKAWTVHVSGPGLFNVEQYPTMGFKSDKLQFAGGKVVAADGQFTLLGVTKPIHLTVSHFACGASPLNKKAMCAADIAATVKRSDFGMVKYLTTVSDEIKINVPVKAYKD